MKVQTVFNIDGENYTSPGSGQEALIPVRNEKPKGNVLLVGFLIDGKFKKVDLFTLNKAQRYAKI